MRENRHAKLAAYSGAEVFRSTSGYSMIERQELLVPGGFRTTRMRFVRQTDAKKGPSRRLLVTPVRHPQGMDGAVPPSHARHRSRAPALGHLQHVATAASIPRRDIEQTARQRPGQQGEAGRSPAQRWKRTSGGPAGRMNRAVRAAALSAAWGPVLERSRLNNHARGSPAVDDPKYR